MKPFELLMSALSDLNELLSENDTTLDITIVGSMAIHLNGLDLLRMTEDIDYINYSPTPIFQKCTNVLSEHNRHNSRHSLSQKTVSFPT